MAETSFIVRIDANLLHKLDYIAKYDAVSYTHLDVYKRQIYGNLNLLPVALGLTIRLTNKSGAWATPMRRFLQQRYLAKKNMKGTKDLFPLIS